MLRATSRVEAQRFLDFLASSGFDEPGFRKRPAMQQLPSRHAGNLPWLLETTAEPIPFNALARLFVFGLTQPAAAVQAVIPAPVLDFILETGMAEAREGVVIPLVMLSATEGRVIAADPIYRMQPEPAPDVMLWPNPSTRLMQQFAFREPCESLLDFGAGCGVVAILASPFCERVVATDLNPRTEEFVHFNAWLNDLNNIECLIGDSFEPLKGRSFDRILANPPFFVLPSSGVMYCENPMELDGFCRHVVRQSAAHLNEGGLLQMVFEWVQVAGQPWQERLASWVEEIGCDAWVLRTYTSDAATYAHERCSNQYADLPEVATAKFDRAVAYYREKQVQEVHGGLLVLRRRSGTNWLRIEEGRYAPGGRFDHLIREIFATQDVLAELPSDDAMLELRPQLSPDAHIDQVLRAEDGKWASTSFKLLLNHSLPASLAIEPQVADFLCRCDGTRTLGEVVRDLAAAVKAPPDLVRQQCCAIVRKLAERRFLSFATAAAAAAAQDPGSGQSS